MDYPLSMDHPVGCECVVCSGIRRAVSSRPADREVFVLVVSALIRHELNPEPKLVSEWWLRLAEISLQHHSEWLNKERAS